MTITLASVKKGQRYIFQENSVEIKAVINIDEQEWILYEYDIQDESRKLQHWPAFLFIETAQRDYITDPYYEGIYPYIYVASLSDPEESAERLNSLIAFNGNEIPLKSFIRQLIETGFKIGIYRGEKGLFYQHNFISEKNISKDGMDFAVYLLDEKGIDPKPIDLPDFLL